MNTTLKQNDLKELVSLKSKLYEELSQISHLLEEIDHSITHPSDKNLNDLKSKSIHKISILNNPKGPNKRKCKCCGNAVSGRKDKIYCTIACKTNYHNILNREVSKVAAKTNSQLRRNYAILLDKTILEQKTKVAQVELEFSGFNFDFHTGFYFDKTRKTEIIRVYDFILRKIQNGVFEVEKLKQPTIYATSRPLKSIDISLEANNLMVAQARKVYAVFATNKQVEKS